MAPLNGACIRFPNCNRLEQMQPYTLNTGHTRVSPRSEVGEEATKQLRTLATAGGAWPEPFAVFYVEITRADGGAVFTVSRAQAPIVTCGVAWTEAGASKV